MNLLIRLLISSIIVFVLAYFLPGVHVADMSTALLVAVVLGLLNTFLKPILVILTIPVTILTLGLFLLVINAFIIMLCAYFINEFTVDGFITALIFSVLLAISQSVLYGIFASDN